MHDIRFIREHPEVFDHALHRRGLPPSAASLMTLDAERRSLQTEIQELQAKRNDLSKQVGEIKRTGGDAEAIVREVAALKDKLSQLEEQEGVIGEQLRMALAVLPNMPAKDVPDGKDEHDNKEVRKSGQPNLMNAPKQHFELGESLELMDFTTAAKLSGARFTMLRGRLARLERALANYMLDTHTQEFGYTEISPPLLVREEIMFGVGQLPKMAEDMFHTTNNMWMIPTAEVPLTAVVYDSIVDADDLPLRMTALTPCFRSEAGAAGKDTRGMLRQHQFYKVELVSVTTPDQSEAEHERMTECAETILKRLGLSFRTMLLCSGDMGFNSRKTYDLEVWLPGQNTYREISSCSNCGDFQARRMNARFKSAGGKGTEFLHTLNGSGLAVGRTLIAVMENYQQSDGSIIIPPVLRPYMGDVERLDLAAA